MGVESLQAVFSPFRGRIVHVTPEQAELLDSVKQMIQLWHAAEEDRGRLAGVAYDDEDAHDLLFDIIMMDDAIAGCASWCEGTRRPDDPEERMRVLTNNDPRRFLDRLKNYPKLREYIHALAHTRELVTRYWDRNYLIQP